MELERKKDKLSESFLCDFITLVNDAYLESGEYRIPTCDGKPSVSCITGQWYQSDGVDAFGNTYLVIWEILEEWADDDDIDQGNACRWNNPSYIINTTDYKQCTESICHIYRKDGSILF